jgi:hypothetical protein
MDPMPSNSIQAPRKARMKTRPSPGKRKINNPKMMAATPRSMKTHQLPAVCFTSCMPKRPVRSMDSGPGGFG